MMKSFVALDVETANQYRSSICSIGAVFVENSKIVDTFYQLIKPTPNFYCHWATAIHGINFYDTIQADEFPNVWKTLCKKIKHLPLVAHNSMFDEGCLHAVLNVYGLPQLPNSFFCTYKKSRKIFPHLPNHQLHTVAEHIGFPLKNHHHALADAEACAHIALKVFS